MSGISTNVGSKKTKKVLNTSKSVKEKAKLTCIKIYGVENPMKSKVVLDKQKQTIDKIDNPKISQVLTKNEKTLLINHYIEQTNKLREMFKQIEEFSKLNFSDKSYEVAEKLLDFFRFESIPYPNALLHIKFAEILLGEKLPIIIDEIGILKLIEKPKHIEDQEFPINSFVSYDQASNRIYKVIENHNGTTIDCLDKDDVRICFPKKSVKPADESLIKLWFD